MRFPHEIVFASAVLLASGQGLAAPVRTGSTTGFNAFRVQDPELVRNAYKCLLEDNGAVVNNCTVAVNLIFDVPVISTGVKTVTVTDYWNAPSRFAAFNCGIFDQSGLTGSSNDYTYVGFTSAKQTVQGSVTVSTAINNGITFRNTVALLCIDVPPWRRHREY